MPFKFYSLVLVTLIWATFISCDDSLTPKDFDEELPYVQNLVVSPPSISFNPQTDGQKDTTLSLNITVDGFNFGVDSVPYYSLFLGDDEVPFLQAKFPVNFSPITTFQTSIPISTNTTEFETYTLLITPSLNGNTNNFAQAIIRQTGVPTNPPEILEVNNPEEVEIPSGNNTVAVLFTAKVQDIDGQSNIDKVLLNFRNEDGSLLRETPFELLDDGSNSSGDITSSDSVYTTTFTINSSNTPNNRTAFYWAIDKSGLSSDTLETPFNLVDNE
ncbi:MAG: hypothetical protein RLN83_13990 [Balneola sp.]